MRRKFLFFIFFSVQILSSGRRLYEKKIFIFCFFQSKFYAPTGNSINTGLISLNLKYELFDLMTRRIFVKKSNRSLAVFDQSSPRILKPSL